MLSNDDKSKLVKLLKELVSAGVTDDKTLQDNLVFIDKKIEEFTSGKIPETAEQMQKLLIGISEQLTEIDNHSQKKLKLLDFVKNISPKN
jgi:transcription termination factor NusB